MAAGRTSESVIVKLGAMTVQAESPIAPASRSSATRAIPRELPTRVCRWTLNVREIERARVIANMTYQQLAAGAHIDRATLSDMVNNRRNPTLGSVHAVIQALGLEPAAVLVVK